MIHYTCDRCKRHIDLNVQVRYSVQIDIQSSTEEPCSEIDDDDDQLAQLNQSLEDFDVGSTDNETDHHGRYDLCQECHDHLLKNPLGRDAVLSLGFSNN